jgi:nucleoside-diphosphate-sugar epimerase
MNKILITGVNGFVGNFLYNEFSIFNDVYGLDIKPNLEIKNMLVCDITNMLKLNEIIKNLDFDIVIHCAALAHNDKNLIKAEEFHRVNVLGTYNLIKSLSSKNVGQFYFLSTISVYGESGYSESINEKMPIIPKTDYARSKFEAEKLVMSSNFKQYFILRMPVIHSSKFLKDIFKRIFIFNFMSINFIFKPGSGKQSHSFCHIKNLSVTLLNLFKHKNIFSSTFNIADSCNYTTNDIVDYFRKNKKMTIVISIPKQLINIFIYLYTLLTNKKHDYKSIYWKLCMNNIYSTEKIKKLDIKLDYTILKTQ